MDNAKKVIGSLNKKQLDFIQNEPGHDLAALNDEDFEKVYDHLGDIEVEETIAAGDGELSDRCRIVESIVTIIRNELYRL